MWQLSVGISKLNRYASRDSGDTAEVVERPGGGLSVVVADAQGSGPAAKGLSSLVTARAVALLKEGVRDEAVHEAVHDHIYHYKGGRVSCTLTTITADTVKRVYTVTRNSPVPAYLLLDGDPLPVDAASASLGIVQGLSPVCNAISLEPGVLVVVVSDGIATAGSRTERPLDLGSALAELARDTHAPQRLADALLSRASELDRGRPVDDMTVAVVGVTRRDREDERRTMTVHMPLRKDMVAAEE
jgi:serine phosphatase RsbU (regulator of sigma subunit)